MEIGSETTARLRRKTRSVLRFIVSSFVDSRLYEPTFQP
jgi:hypothetical protein